MNREKQIEDAMNSLENIRQAEASPFLYSKILNRIHPLQTERTSVKWAWLTAASFLILLLLNFGVAFSGSHSVKSDVQELSQAFQLMNTATFNYKDHE